MKLSFRFASSLVALLPIACSSAASSSAPPSNVDAGGASTLADASTSSTLPDSSSVIADTSTLTDSPSSADACPAIPPGSPHAITGDVAFTTDSSGVPFGTQNGSVVHIATTDLVGKTLVWATAPGGAQIANIPAPLEAGTATIGADLTAHFTTGAKYTNGPWELVVFVSVTGGDLTKGPQSGDIAAFDLTPPPACQPPVTGVSIRVTIDNADASTKLDNNSFIRF